MSTSCEIASTWIPQNTFDHVNGKSTLVKVMVWCRWFEVNVDPHLIYQITSLGPNEQNRLGSNTEIEMLKFWQNIVTGCTRMDLSHKSHNAPVPYPTMHHFCSRNVHVCTFLLQNGALCDIVWCIVEFKRLIYPSQWQLPAHTITETHQHGQEPMPFFITSDSLQFPQ